MGLMHKTKTREQNNPNQTWVVIVNLIPFHLEQMYIDLEFIKYKQTKKGQAMEK